MPEPMRPQPRTPTFLIVILIPLFTTEATEDHRGLFSEISSVARDPYSYEALAVRVPKLSFSYIDPSPAKTAGSGLQKKALYSCGTCFCYRCKFSTIIAMPCPP